MIMYVMYFIMAIFAFGVLIIVHELGHFTLAKLNGVRVEEFSIGMGPKIFSKQGKETKYSLGILPIGGYVKMMGEEENVADERSFSSKSPLKRISIIIAGVFMNYVLAMLIFTFQIHNFGYTNPIPVEVKPSSPAYEAGILAGDKILKVNNLTSFSYDNIYAGVALSYGNPINVSIERDGEKKDITVIPEKNADDQLEIGLLFSKVQNPNYLESFKQSFNKTESLVSQTFKGLEMIFKGKANLKTDVGGPVTIIKMSTKTAEAGIWPLLSFTAFLSVNLAVFNLLPFPALDGGWCVILLIELITRRKVPDKIVAVLNYIGFAALIGLMLLVTIKDLLFPIKF